MIGFIVLLLLNVASIPLSGWIAERRGRSIKLWCWMGAIFGPIAPLVVALLPSAPPNDSPPASALNELGRQTRGQASGRRGEPHNLDMVLISTA